MILFVAVFSEEYRFLVRGVFGGLRRREVMLVFQVQVRHPILIGKGEFNEPRVSGRKRVPPWIVPTKGSAPSLPRDQR